MASEFWFSCIFSTMFFASYVSGQFQVDDEPKPQFLAPLANFTVAQGRDVHFTCVVNHLGQYKVAWIKSDSKAILAIHTHLVAHNPRLSVTHNGHNAWTLHVSSVQKNDSGTYMCQINTNPMTSQMGYLDVVIPPDILDDDESSDGGVAPENGSVRLRCRATGIPEPNVTWKREDTRDIVFRYEGGREREVVKVHEGDTLLLTAVQRTDMGTYFCIATNGHPPTVSKKFTVQVHFHPLIKVSNQLVAAPVGSDVLIQCYVEASPKALNSWYKDTGEKLVNGTKYSISEVTINEYSLFMNLTIRKLEKRDFGGYMCASVNALGKVEGSVRLQELYLDQKTTIPSVIHKNRTSKDRKKPTGHMKIKHLKGKHRKSEFPFESREFGDDEDEGLETVTTGSWVEPRTMETIKIPNASRPPSWTHHLLNDVSNTAINLRIPCDCLPMLVASFFVIKLALQQIVRHHV